MSRKPHTPAKAATTTSSESTTESPKVRPEESVAPWPPTITLPVDAEVPDRAPNSPHSLSLSLNGERRRKLHALRSVLRDHKATIHARRGGAQGEQLVLTFNDTILWLLDQVQVEE